MLSRRLAFLAHPMSFIIALAIGAASVVLHNLVSGWLDTEEPVFFLLALLALGVTPVLFLLWLGNLLFRHPK